MIDLYETRLLRALSRRAVGAGQLELALALPWCSLADLVPDGAGKTWRALITVPYWAHRGLPAGATRAATRCAEDVMIAGRPVTDVELHSEPAVPRWRREADDLARGAIGKQGSVAGLACYSEGGLRFRSRSEMLFARELRRRDLPFLALPAYHWHGSLREPDFMVIVRGRLYAVEIHGEPYHPSGRTAIDYERDLIYRLAGVDVVVLDAARVRANPAASVELVLAIASMHAAA